MTVPDLKAFGREVRRERLRLGLTQGDFALAAGLCRETVNAVENGSSHPSLRTRTRLLRTIDRLDRGETESVWLGLGRAFRLARLGSGVTLKSIALRIDVPLKALEALEAGYERKGESYEQVGRYAEAVAGHTGLPTEHETGTG